MKDNIIKLLTCIIIGLFLGAIGFGIGKMINAFQNEKQKSELLNKLNIHLSNHSISDSTLISNIINTSDFKCIKIGENDDMDFYKVFINHRSENGNYTTELLVTKYYYSVSVQPLTCYSDSIN